MALRFHTSEAFRSSYFLPSRAYGLNDMTRLPRSRSPFRVQLAWAVMLLPHTLFASRIEMHPGDYDNAQFAYTPPASTHEALEQAGAFVHFHDGLAPHDLLNCVVNGPPSQTISRLDIARLGQVIGAREGVHEFQLLFLTPHMITDAPVVHRCVNVIFKILLVRFLEDEWSKHWARGSPPTDVIVASAETRLGGIPSSKLCKAGWKVGGQVLPRIFPKNKNSNIRILWAKISRAQTAAIFAKCKAQRVTFGNLVFALCNLAWIRVCTAHPHLATRDSRVVPDADVLRHRPTRYLPWTQSLSPNRDLRNPLWTCRSALGYHTVSLPVLASSNVLNRGSKEATTLFWHRARSAQCQMRIFTHHRQPEVLRGRVLATALVRAERSQSFARALAMALSLPPALVKQQHQPPALLGVTHSGDTSTTYFTSRYPSLKLIDYIGGSRKGPGGTLLSSRTFLGQLSLLVVVGRRGWLRRIGRVWLTGCMSMFWEMLLGRRRRRIL
ncbi:hypothetical protein C8F01DRAFT_1068396 [Mycena amicta]|nr:hypothetical protein C8F01DRAFT_1068396 [Mycena amicta]